MIHFGESKYPQLVTLWEVEDKGSYALVKMGTSRKIKGTDEYANSNWSFVRFVGQAYEGITDVKLKSKIVIKAGGISLEPYMKDNVKTWPKNPQIVVFAWDYPEDSGQSRKNEEPEETVEDSEELPF